MYRAEQLGKSAEGAWTTARGRRLLRGDPGGRMILLGNSDGSRHLLMFLPAEVITMKLECSGRIRRKTQRCDFPWGDVTTDFQGRAEKAMQSVQGGELQDNGNSFFHRDGVGGILKLFDGDLDGLLCGLG